MQEGFPFVFTNFLERYLHLLLQLLINYSFRNEKLLKCVLASNCKPLTTFPYYANETQMEQVNQGRRVSEPSFANEQIKCHQQFLNIYGGMKATAFMEKSIT
jgi:hypothetical protein